ncbi:hypothetical protein PPACK8108_LOCUS4411 [Phakopsora pachyrhizi]|uniref:Uncharacterized protein n=1 Tax=Phakopsora pachyrhizi TaxID=170000 RepID=A0AAV0AM69_PHAPC|nr:hypothetical protein PPACK8108_LOCUS4411 [Phakopsora pachyrhizi]
MDASNKKLEPQISKASTKNKEHNRKKVRKLVDHNDPHPNRETIREVSLGGTCPLKIPINEIKGSNPQPVSTSLNDPSLNDPRCMTQAINPFAHEPALYSHQLNQFNQGRPLKLSGYPHIFYSSKLLDIPTVAAANEGSIPASALEDELRQDSSIVEVAVVDDDDDNEGRKGSKDDETVKVQYHYTLFYMTFALETMYVAMLLTHWLGSHLICHN